MKANGESMKEITDTERLDFLIENRVSVISNPDICDGYWLEEVNSSGQVWVYIKEYGTPRDAIDAAIKSQEQKS